MNKKRFGIDIDGTVTAPSTFIPYLNEHFKKNLTIDDITEYELSSALGISKEEFDKWMKIHESNIYKRAELAVGVHPVLSEWKNEHDLYYISARPSDFHELTRNWFIQYELPYDHIELIGTHDKISAVKKHGVHIFFEDKHDNACSIAEACGIPVILMDTPYNQEPVHKFVHRVSDWNTAKKVVKELL
ncbi:hypothetical protein [Evansella halocellulosilytica]|uniref:hypothetical protein n=1 Tax=Evansella halocellulosilytica TaxID=2011013 RepID=UPI000BB87328|nr:hypothetical protein [Evansella halocellulosilytica]